MISATKKFAIAARNAAIVQSASQTKWGIASRRRKKTVRRERRPSSASSSRTVWGGSSHARPIASGSEFG